MKDGKDYNNGRFDSPNPISTAIVSKDVGPTQSLKYQDNPIIFSLVGSTGVGKTVLASLFALECGISYDIGALANQAGIKLDYDPILKKLNLNSSDRVYVHFVPKVTTREARPGEIQGVDFYFLSKTKYQRLKKQKKFSFTYKYPSTKKGKYYGVFSDSVNFPLENKTDSINVFTGFNAFNKMNQAFPDSVSIFVNAPAIDIENHINGRTVSQKEKEIRLEAFRKDLKDFSDHRHEIPYSVSLQTLDPIRPSITYDKIQTILRELDAPLRQLKAISRWERYLKQEKLDSLGIQEKYDCFLDLLVKRVFNGMEFDELKDRVEKGDSVQVIDPEKDAETLEKYSLDKGGLSMSLLNNIAKELKVNSVCDANGRRTLVLSRYDDAYIPGADGSSKKVIVELIKKKLNGYGAHVSQERTGDYKNFSAFSALKFNGEIGVEEGLYIFLSSDHIPITELDRPRSLNILFSNSTVNSDVKNSIIVPSLEELTEEAEKMVGQRIAEKHFISSLPPSN